MLATGKAFRSRALCALALLSTSAAKAAPLYLELDAAPNIFSSFINVSYDATTETLTTTGFALNIDDDGVGPPHPIDGGTFSLVATIDAAGILAPGGTIVIQGTVPTLGFNSGVLITGDLTAFGYRPGGGDPLEFRFDITGGDVAAHYQSTEGGIILSSTSFAGSFTAGFGNAEAANGVADTAPAKKPICRANASTKGSLLFFSKVEIKWSADGTQLLQDTFLSIVNDAASDVEIQAYFVEGDPPVEEICGDPLCESIVQEFEPGWNTADCRFSLTRDQSHSWSAARGSNRCPPFVVLDSQGPGRPDPETANTTRILRGFVVMWAVKFNPSASDSDGRGLFENIRWNHLEGSGLIVNYVQGSAWEYNAWSFQVCDPAIPHGAAVGDPGWLMLDGLQYNTPPSALLLDFYASSSTAVSSSSVNVIIDTDLTVHPVDLDLRQDGCGPVLTKVEASIWNENESKFSGTRRCVCCWDQTMLRQWSRSASIPNHFLRSTLHTDKGKARLEGVASTECDYATICGREPSPNPECYPEGNESARRFAVETPLLGLATKFLTYSGIGLAKIETSAINLIGLGNKAATIHGDVVYGPYERFEEASEKP